MSWKLAPSLATLFAEINTEWPKRDRSLDGTVGDAAHAARKSEHNPNADPHDDVPDGMVTACDIDKDGINVPRVINALVGEPRVWYVIHDRRIYSRTHAWEPRTYEGPNPHTGHIHVSLMQTREACLSTRPWGIHETKPTPPPAKETPYQRVARIAHQRLVKIRALRRKLRG